MNKELFIKVIYNKVLYTYIIKQVRKFDRDETGYTTKDIKRWDQLSSKWLIVNSFFKLYTYWLRVHYDSIELLEHSLYIDGSLPMSIQTYDKRLDKYQQLFEYSLISPFLKKNTDLGLFLEVFFKFNHIFRLAHDIQTTSLKDIKNQVHILEDACLGGNIEIVEVLIRNGFEPIQYIQTLYNACLSGNLPLVQRIFKLCKENKASLDRFFIQISSLEHNFKEDTLLYLVENMKPKLTSNLFSFIVKRNYCKIVRYVASLPDHFTIPFKEYKPNFSIWNVALGASFEMFNLFIELFEEKNKISLNEYSIKYFVNYYGDDPDQFLKYYVMVPDSTFKHFTTQLSCISFNKINLLKTLTQLGGISNSISGLYIEALKCMNIEALTYLNSKVEERIDNSTERIRVMEEIVEKGNIELIKILHSMKNQPFRPKLMSIAARRGHLEMVKWLNENRTEGGEDYTLNWCIIARQYKVIDYILDECMSFINKNSYETTKSACIIGDISLLERLLFLGFPIDSSAMDEAAIYNQLHVVQYLHSKRTEGCTIRALNNSAFNGNIEVVRFLHFNRTEGCTTIAMDNAIQNNHLDVLKFLHECRTEGCTSNGVDRALTNNNFEIIKFIVENRTERWSELGLIQALKMGNIKLARYAINVKNSIRMENLTPNLSITTHLPFKSIRFLFNVGMLTVKDVDFLFSILSINFDIDFKMFLLSLIEPTKKYNNWNSLRMVKNNYIGQNVSKFLQIK